MKDVSLLCHVVWGPSHGQFVERRERSNKHDIHQPRRKFKREIHTSILYTKNLLCRHSVIYNANKHSAVIAVFEIYA